MADAPPAWAAVVVNYNAGDLLATCVASLLADDALGPPEIVVVDNASHDGSADAMAAAYPSVTVIRSPVNHGYARAANLGIAATRAPIVAVVNPDARVLPGTAAALARRLEAEPGVGALGPRIDNPDGTAYPSARTVPRVVDAVGHGLLVLVWPANPFTRRYRQTGADPDRPRDVDWLSGSALWLRRRALDEVGGWDERYFMYVEDVDLCWRLRRAGWRVAYEPRGRVVHVQGASTSGVPYRMLVEHHRSLYRFAAMRWTGSRRVLLVPAAAFLAFRAGLAIVHHRLAARRGPRGASG